MSELKEGDKAPDFELSADDGKMVHLAELQGKKVVLFFYPKADTPGCTTEACEFRDHHKEFGRKTAVYGISPDAAPAQSKFRQKFSLPYPLLCDTDHTVAESYGVWKEKSMYGRKYMGIERTTFVIDEEGKIAKIFRKVKPAGHASEVLEAV